MNSSKKWTNEFIFTTMQRVFVHFLEEIEDSKKAFRNYFTFKRKFTFVSNSAPKAISKRKHCRFYRILHLIGPSIKSPAAKAKTKDLPRLAKRPGIIKSIEHRKPFEHVLLAPSKRAVPPPTAMPTLWFLILLIKTKIKKVLT